MTASKRMTGFGPSRLVPLVGAVTGLGLLAWSVGLGRPRGPGPVKPAPASNLAPARDARATGPEGGAALIDGLVRDKSEAALAGLLRLNGLTPPDDFDLRCVVPWGAGNPEDGVISNPSRIRSGGAEYVAAPIVSVAHPGRAALRSGRGFLFTADGRLLGGFGDDAAPGRPGGYVDFVSLGTPDTWFIRVGTWEKSGPFDMVCEIHSVGPMPVRLIRYRHRSNGAAFSRVAADAKDGSFLAFPDVDRPQVASYRGKDALGHEADARLTWDGARGRFVGPSTVVIDGKARYLVEVDSSAGFDPTDARP